MKIRNSLCSKCGQKNGTSSSYCAKCHNECQKAYYKKNPRSIDASVVRRRVRIRKQIVEAKDKPCADCEKKYPWYVMDFDHVRGKKRFNLSKSTSRLWSAESIALEMSKCDVVCANCHRTRTFERRMAIASSFNLEGQRSLKA